MSNVETLKILLIGNSSAGKSSLLLRFIHDVWEPEDSQATIGVDFKTKTIHVDGKKVKLTIWDTAGQERFRTLTSSYYRGCQGVLVVFDVSNRSSYDQVPKWFSELASHSGNDTNAVSFIVGNKVDRPGRLVMSDEGAELVRKVAADGYYEVSAKDGTNVTEVFTELARQVLARLANAPRQTESSGRIDIDNRQVEADSGCAC